MAARSSRFGPPARLAPHPVPDVGPQLLTVEPRRGDRDLEQRVRDARHVALVEREHQTGEAVLRGLLHVRDAAEVQHADPAAGHQHDVPRVRIVVEGADPEDHVQEDAGGLGGQRVRIVDHAGPRRVLQRAPVEALHREDLLGAHLVERLGDHHVGAPGERRAEERQARGLAAQVHLGLQRPRQLAHDPPDPEPRGLLAAVLGDLGQRAEDLEGGPHLLGDAGVADLHDHLAPVLQRGRMDLPDGGGGERLEVERAEGLFERAAQLALDDRAHDLGRIGGRLLAQPLELAGDVVADEVAARAEDLPELDEGRPQVLQRHPQPLRIGELAQLRVGPRRDLLAQPRGGVPGPGGEPEARQDAEDLLDARAVAQQDGGRMVAEGGVQIEGHRRILADPRARPPMRQSPYTRRAPPG